MRVVVTGSRDETRQKMVSTELSAFHARTPITLLIHGGAEGVDRLARSWAEAHMIPCCCFYAPWHHAKPRTAAGPIRNGWMIQYGLPDMLLAFPGGKGTANMKKQADAKGLPTTQLGVKGQDTMF